MKKTIAVFVALLLLSGFTSLIFAKDNENKSTQATEVNMVITRGKVVSVDTANKTIIVTDNKTQQNITFVVVGEKAIAEIQNLKPGDEVKVKVKGNSNQTESVKKVGSEKEEAGE